MANRKRLFHKSWVISITWKPICILTGHYSKESHTRFSILLTSSRAQVLGTLKSCRKLYTVWCRLETVLEEPQHILVSWIHPRVCNNLVLSFWPCSSNPLIILVAFLCVQIHQTPFLHCGHGFENWFKRLDPCRRGGCKSYSCVFGIACVLWKGKPEVICCL